MSEAPRITYYARVLDNITNQEVLGYMSNKQNSTWYYGQCSLNGGESQYIVEFDIWNNEPAFDAGSAATYCEDAKNCKLTVWPTKDCQSTVDSDLFRLPTPFMQVRCVTNGYDSEYTNVRFDQMFTGIEGNVKPDEIRTLKGAGDHAILQTKINLTVPDGFNFAAKRYPFVFAFYYDYV